MALYFLCTAMVDRYFLRMVMIIDYIKFNTQREVSTEDIKKMLKLL
jgi:hypothetical protein